MDRDRGLGLLYVFAAAVAVMVGGLFLAAAVNSSWILVVTTVLLGLTTLLVFAAIFRLLADEGANGAP